MVALDLCIPGSWDSWLTVLGNSGGNMVRMSEVYYMKKGYIQCSYSISLWYFWVEITLCCWSCGQLQSPFDIFKKDGKNCYVLISCATLLIVLVAGG